VGNFPIQVRAKDAKSTKTIGVIVSNYLNRPVDPPPPETADYYVATAANGGSDSNPGTISQPFLTINKATSVMTSGQLCYVRAGTFAERITSLASGGGSWATATRIFGYPSESVTIQPGSGSACINFDSVTENWLHFKNLILDAVNITSGVPAVKLRGTNVHHVRLEDIEAKNAPGLGSGVLVNAPSHHCEIIGGRYHDNGLIVENSAAYGMYIESADNLIDGCEVDANGGYGIHIYSSTGGADNNVVRRCRVHNNSVTAIFARSGITAQNGTGTLIYSNLIYDEPGEAGIYISSGAVSVKIYHNTVYSNTASGIKLRNACDLTEIINNITFSNGTNIDRSGDTNTTQSNNVTTDPSFVDGATPPYNFHLQSGSAARNVGTNLQATVPTDYDGVAHDTVPDVGAYEFV
jgi:hypothetical protein